MRFRGKAYLVNAILLACLLVWAPLVAAQDLSEVLRSAGLSPLQPATPASDFTLPNIDGGEQSLSEMHGKWVLLTFFATWCGPCASEMPSLQDLHRSLADEGLVVMAVSTDRSSSQVVDYIRNRALTFPVLLDSEGRVARAYGASAIPLSYLIDPSGLMVGMARGAHDWGGFKLLFDEIASTSAAGSTTSSAYRPQAEPVELPDGIEPPTAQASLQPQQVRPGQKVVLKVEVHWNGDIRDYSVLPPKVDLPEGLEQTGTSASSDSLGGRQLIVYEIGLLARQEGDYSLDPLEVRYLPYGSKEPLVARVQGPTLEVLKHSWHDVAPWTLLLGCTLSLAVLLGVVLLLRRRQTSTSPPPTEPGQELKAAIHEAHARRVAGDIDGFVSVLLPALSGIDADSTTTGILRQWRDRVRYGGFAPSAQDLDQVERQARQVLKVLLASRDSSKEQSFSHEQED